MAEPATLAELAAELLAVSAQCLEDHTPSGAPDCTFIGHGSGAVPYRDEYLSVQVDPMVPTTVFPNPLTTPSIACQEIGWAVTFTVRIHRCPYPHLTGEGGQPNLPTPAELTAASEGLLYDARALQCCLPDAWRNGDLWQNPLIPTAPVGYDVASLPVLWGAMTAFREGNKAGWDWPITAGVDPCCALPITGSGS